MKFQAERRLMVFGAAPKMQIRKWKLRPGSGAAVDVQRVTGLDVDRFPETPHLGSAGNPSHVQPPDSTAC